MNIGEKPPKARLPCLYLAPLDGLRFFAFLAVFGHHLPRPPASAALAKLDQYGWVGVELFFAISAYLFFHLLNAESTSRPRKGKRWQRPLPHARRISSICGGAS